MNIDWTNINAGRLDLGGQSVAIALADKVFDPTNPVIVHNGIVSDVDLLNCANIHFENVQLTKFLAQGGGNIRATDFTVRAPGVSSSHTAIMMRNVNGFAVADGDLRQFNIGVSAVSSDNGEVLRNSFREFNEDCVRVVSARDILIEDNDFTDFLLVASGPGVHPDAIQGFLDQSGRQIQRVTIRGNRIWRGAGNGIQGIFFRGYTGKPSPDGLVIEHNIIVGPNKNAIVACGRADIRDNLVIDHDPVTRSHISWSGPEVTLSGNTAPKYTDTAIGFNTPVPAANTLGPVITPAEAQALVDGWRPVAPPPPPQTPAVDLVAVFGADVLAALDARYAPNVG